MTPKLWFSKDLKNIKAKDSLDSSKKLNKKIIKDIPKLSASLFENMDTNHEPLNSQIDIIFNIISSDPWNISKFEQKSQSNYKSVIKNYEIWNCKIIKSEKFYLEDKIYLEIEINWNNIIFTKEDNDSWISNRSISVNNKWYIYNTEKQIYIHNHQNILPKQDIDLINKIKEFIIQKDEDIADKLNTIRWAQHMFWDDIQQALWQDPEDEISVKNWFFREDPKR